MRIAIDIDGVLRDTFTKIEQIYQKYFIDELELVDDDFNYEIITPYDTPEYSNHFKFKTDEEYLSFMYEEFAMEIFGHSPSTEMSTFYDLNDLIVKYKDNWIRVDQHPESIKLNDYQEPYLYCINTDNKIIEL